MRTRPVIKTIAILGAGVVLLTACADQSTRSTSSLMHDIEVKAGTNVIVRSAAGMPAGIYPGRKDDAHAYQRQKYEAYLVVAQPWITALGARQDAINHGQARVGCIGEDVLTCMVTLSRVLAVATRYSDISIDPARGVVSILGGSSDDPLLQQTKTAVDGKLIFLKTLRFYAYVPGQDEGILPRGIAVTVDLDDNWRIRRLSATLPHDPMGAHTAEEYDKTGIFELVTAAGVQPCKMARQELYRTFEAQLKPGLSPSHNIDVDMTSASETYGKHGKLDVCGRGVWFFSTRGVSTDLISRNNMSGSFGGGSLQIE